MSPSGKRSMLKLAQRMVDNFCAGVTASTVRKWDKLCVGTVGEDVRVMTRKSMDDPGEPPGIILSAATSVWIPVSQKRLFEFLRDERFRSDWDILSNGGPMQEMVHITKCQRHGNHVSLLRASVSDQNIIYTFFLSFSFSRCFFSFSNVVFGFHIELFRPLEQTTAACSYCKKRGTTPRAQW